MLETAAVSGNSIFSGKKPVVPLVSKGSSQRRKRVTRYEKLYCNSFDTLVSSGLLQSVVETVDVQRDPAGYQRTRLSTGSPFRVMPHYPYIEDNLPTTCIGSSPSLC